MASASRPAAARDLPAWELAPATEAGSLEAAQASCRAIAAAHYENFSVVTRLVPRRLRQDFATIYAFARWSDDLADEAASPVDAARALADWRLGLEACFAGQATHPIFVALADTVRRTGLTIEPFSDLLDAFEQDQWKTRFATRAELLDYCRRSADPVGRIVLGLEGCREPRLLERSDAICTGLQLVNFWQDLKRDRLAGRVYLPADDMRRHGVDETMLDLSCAPPLLRDLVREEVTWARDCFDRGSALADQAPPALRPAIRMFLGGGRAIAAAIERQDFDTLARRPLVSKATKVMLASRAWIGLHVATLRGAR